ncbi:MAG: hypothetical protein ACRD3T_09020 [Terriglobia bacterium]
MTVIRAFRSLSLAVFMLVASFAWAQASYKVAPASLPGSSNVPQSVLGALEAQGESFQNSAGTAICEVWFRKGIPVTKSASSSADVIYGGMSVGEWVGLIHFPQKATDYRGQAIKPGYYTLRYAQIPQDGNHMGVSTYRDFLLMSPVAADTQPNQDLSFDALVKLSRQTAGTGHPAILMLDPAHPSSAFPGAVADDQGNWTLQVKLDTNAQPAQLPFAVVLVGQYQG